MSLPQHLTESEMDIWAAALPGMMRTDLRLREQTSTDILEFRIKYSLSDCHTEELSRLKTYKV